MRTKNAKRLWPVPATLTVVAVAAFLAFGLMATTGTQPAAAQDADCTVTIATVANEGANADGLSIAGDVVCDANGDTATIKLVGPADRPAATAGAIAVYVLAKDNDGSEDIYPAGATWQAVEPVTGDRERGTIYTTSSLSDATEAMATSYAGQNVTVPRAVQQGTKYVAQSTIVTVQGEGTVHIYLPEEFASAITENIGCANDTGAACDTDDPSPPSNAQMFTSGAPADNTATVTIRFLGAPALGKDLDTDFNPDLDDEVMEQCVLTEDVDDADAKLLGEAEVCTNHPDEPDDEDWVASTEIVDVAESRSKLVVRTGLKDATSSGSNPLIDGTTLTHEMDDADAVTIYAVIEDAKGEPLEDTEVSFSSSTNPSGIVAPRDLMDEGDAEEAGTTLASTLDGVIETDAIVAYELTGLAKVEGPYSITVEVMAGDLNLGTVTLTRADAPDKIAAGVFNAACFKAGGTANEPDYLLAMFNAKDKGCDDSGMASRFGAGEMIFVKAHLEDSLDNVVGESDDLDSELADEFDDPLIDGDPVVIVNPVNGKLEPKAWVYTVDEDAMLGDHMITVSTTAKTADDEAIDDVTLTVTVAGPPTQYMFVDPVDNIELGDRATFTVQAYDAVGGTPHFGATLATDNKVEVFIQGLPNGNTRNLDATSMLTLDKDTGRGTFTVFVPNNAEDGDTIRIFVASGAMEQQIEVTFGEPGVTPGPDPMDDMFTAMHTVMATSPSSGMVDVSWMMGGDFDTSLIMLMQDGDVVKRQVSFNDAMELLTEVAAGAYDVAVLSFKAGDTMVGATLAFGEVTVQ